MNEEQPEDHFAKHGKKIALKPGKAGATNGSAPAVKVPFPLVKFKDLKPGTAVRYLIKPIIPASGLTLGLGAAQMRESPSGPSTR